MTEWKNIKLGDLFNEEQIEDIELLLRERDFDNLRVYLNKLKEQLEKKGVLPDYLYYWFEANFKK